MTEKQLQTALRTLADEVTVVVLGPRVRARTQFVRRRRRTVLIGAAIGVACGAVALLLGVPSQPESAPPAERLPNPVVDLTKAPIGGLSGATVAVLDVDSGVTWLVTPSGRAARLTTKLRGLPGQLPTLTSGGAVLSFGSHGAASLVRTSDGSQSELSTRDGQAHQVAVSPDGRTVAFASDNQVDAIELTLVRRDGASRRTLTVTSGAAAGALLPVVWSDDGSAILVLDGKGATRVDLTESPRARPGVHVFEDVVLSHGWAVAPDLSRFVMGVPATVAGQRRWVVFDARDGKPAGTVARPAADRLIGWTSEERLVWWQEQADGYVIVSTDVAGRSAHVELRIDSGRPHLKAVWTEDDA